MNRLTTAILIALLSTGIVSMDAIADEVVILACRADDSSVSPVRPINIDSCSSSSGASIQCPQQVQSCSQLLADYLSGLGNYSIQDVQPYSNDGLIYTLVSNAN